MAVSRFPSRSAGTVTPRHLWLAGLGLVAVARRGAVAARSRLSASADEFKARAGRAAGSVRHRVQGQSHGLRFNADVEARLAPVLDKLGLGKSPSTVRKSAKAGARSRRAPGKRPARKA